MEFYWQPVATRLPRFEYRIKDTSALLMTLFKSEDGHWNGTCLHKTLTGLGDVTEDEAKRHCEQFLILIVDDVLRNLRKQCCV